MRIEPDAQQPCGRALREAAADRQRVGDLLAEIIDQRDKQFIRCRRLVHHLSRAQRRSGIADHGVRHRAQPPVATEIMRRCVRGVADEADGAGVALGRRRADGRRVSHHLRHLLTGAVTRVHGEEGHLGQIDAHRIGVIGGNAGRTDLLQIDRLEIDEVPEGTGDVEQRLAGADPGAFGITQVDLELGLARGGDGVQPVDREARREDDRPPHEDGVGHGHVAEALDRRFALHKVTVGIALDIRCRGSRRIRARPVHVSLPRLRSADGLGRSGATP